MKDQKEVCKRRMEMEIGVEMEEDRVVRDYEGNGGEVGRWGWRDGDNTRVERENEIEVMKLEKG